MSVDQAHKLPIIVQIGDVDVLGDDIESASFEPTSLGINVTVRLKNGVIIRYPKKTYVRKDNC